MSGVSGSGLATSTELLNGSCGELPDGEAAGPVDRGGGKRLEGSRGSFTP